MYKKPTEWQQFGTPYNKINVLQSYIESISCTFVVQRVHNKSICCGFEVRQICNWSNKWRSTLSRCTYSARMEAATLFALVFVVDMTVRTEYFTQHRRTRNYKRHTSINFIESPKLSDHFTFKRYWTAIFLTTKQVKQVAISKKVKVLIK